MKTMHLSTLFSFIFNKRWNGQIKANQFYSNNLKESYLKFKRNLNNEKNQWHVVTESKGGSWQETRCNEIDYSWYVSPQCPAPLRVLCSFSIDLSFTLVGRLTTLNREITNYSPPFYSRVDTIYIQISRNLRSPFADRHLCELNIRKYFFYFWNGKRLSIPMLQRIKRLGKSIKQQVHTICLFFT